MENFYRLQIDHKLTNHKENHKELGTVPSDSLNGLKMVFLLYLMDVIADGKDQSKQMINCHFILGLCAVRVSTATSF